MAFTEPEVYKEDEVFDESSDEEGDLLIKSAFEETRLCPFNEETMRQKCIDNHGCFSSLDV